MHNGTTGTRLPEEHTHPIKPKDVNVPCAVARRVCGDIDVSVTAVRTRRCTLMMKHDVSLFRSPLGCCVLCNRSTCCCISVRSAAISARWHLIHTPHTLSHTSSREIAGYQYATIRGGTIFFAFRDATPSLMSCRWEIG